MSHDLLYTLMNQIEEDIDKSVRVLGLYRIVNKSALYSKFKLLYDSLPQELIYNKDYLNKHKKENVFTLLNEMSFLLEKSTTCLGYMLINANIMINCIDKLYASLPEDIKICCENETNNTGNT